jgi:hypothetical protein
MILVKLHSHMEAQYLSFWRVGGSDNGFLFLLKPPEPGTATVKQTLVGLSHTIFVLILSPGLQFTQL